MNRSRKARCAATSIVAICLLAAPATAAADTDIGAANGDRIAATLGAADDVATFRYTIPAGAKLSIAAKGTKKRGAAAPVVTFRVLEPDGDEAAPFQPVKGSGAKLANLVATTSGAWRVEVKTAGGAAGDFSLSVRWRSTTRFAATATLAPGETSTIPFAADAGATAAVTASPARGSAALARVVGVRTADATYVVPADQPEPAARSHKVRGVPLTPGGDFLARIGNAVEAPGGGEVTASVVVKPPKLRPRAVTVTAKQIGADDGAAAVGQVIGPEGGAVLVGDEIAGVAGAAVQIPTGALAFPAAIVIGTSAPITPPTGLGVAGPAVFFGPDGTKFGESVTITIPYDARAATSSVRVFTRDAKGKVTEVLPASLYVFDAGAGTVSFPSSHFSSYQAFSRLRVRADVNGDGFADLLIPSSESGASRQGRIDVFFGSANVFPAEGETSIVRQSSEADVTFTGVAVNDELGEKFNVADVNGDGVDDLCAGLRGATRFVVVWFGGPDFSAGGAPDLTITPGPDDPNFGISIAGGDLNGDGVDDLVVGDESNNRGGGNTGACFVFFGPLTSNLTASDADVIIQGEATGDLFGAHVAVADVTNTGATPSAQDLIVGADRIDNVSLPSGSLYVFGGGMSPGSRSAATADVILTGENSGDGFGLPFVVADVDGGGRADVVVAATLYDAGAAVDAGRVYVFRSEGTGVTNGATPIGTFTGALAGDRAGSGLWAANFTGSLAAEVAVGLPGSDADAPDGGAIAIWDGTTNTTYVSGVSDLTGRRAGGAIGEALLYGADLDGDGLADLIVGDPLDNAQLNAGACFVFPGRAAGFLPSAALAAASLVIRGAPGQRLGD